MKPTTAQQASEAGYLWVPDDAKAQHEFRQYLQQCERQGRVAVSVTPRRAYASINVQMPPNAELSPELALFALRTLHTHHSPGRVRLQSILLQRIPLRDAESVARRIAQLTPPPCGHSSRRDIMYQYQPNQPNQPNQGYNHD